jgi:hypothetical protein
LRSEVKEFYQGVSMSGQRKTPSPTGKSDIQGVLDDILNFGPDPQVPKDDFSTRIKAIVKKLQEINQRIENLSQRS